MAGVSDRLFGKLFFSKRQLLECEKKGHQRKIGLTLDGRLVEYTQLVTVDEMKEDDSATCEYADAVFLGYGGFHKHLP